MKQHALHTGSSPDMGPLGPSSNFSGNADHRSEALAVDELFFCAALLGGLGAHARPAASELTADLGSSATEGRTCIDGGSPVMFSLLAPGARTLRVLTRRGSMHSDIHSWTRTHFQPDGRAERWHTLNFAGEIPAAWENARNAAEFAGELDRLRRTHAVLGLHGHLCSVSWTDVASSCATAPKSWISWQLDRTLPANDALAVLGCGDAWKDAQSVWETLLGVSPNPRRGPWSISLLLGEDRFRLRLGSTNWARQMEGSEKRRRLALLVERQGGDRRFAESLYKLVESTAGSPPSRAIGRAVELELVDGKAESVEFYLSIH